RRRRSPDAGVWCSPDSRRVPVVRRSCPQQTGDQPARTDTGGRMTPEEPLSDDDMTTTPAGDPMPGGGDADGTDGGDADGTDGGDADGTDGDASDGDASDGDGTDGGDAD